MIPDIIGTIRKEVGPVREDGTRDTVEVPGYHVNFPEPLGDQYEQFRTEPATPQRVYFSAPTYFYTFPGRAHFRQLFPEPEEVNE